MEIFESSEKLKEFKNAINQTISEIISLKNIEEEVNNLILVEKESDLFYEFLFFTNYKKLLFLKFNFDCDNHNLLFEEFSKMKIYNDKNNLYKDLFQTIFHMHLFFLIKIENTIASIYKNIYYDFKEIKYSYMILIHIANLLFILYQENIYSINKILLFFEAIIIFINKQSIISDRYLKLKNAILFDLLIDKFYLQFLKLTLNRQDKNKNDISSILNYLIKSLKSKQMKSYFNYSILINCNILEKIISVLFNNSNFLNGQEIYKKYKNNLIECFSDIYKNNTNNSNLFETLIKQNKNNFVNLMNFETKKEFISNDILIQDFYLELLNTIFSKEKESKTKKKEIIDMENFFVFNGDNSKMSFYFFSFSFDNPMLIFSFRLNHDIDIFKNSAFPLIIFEAAEVNDIIFEILIKKVNNINKLFIYQDKKKENKKKEICLEKIQKILIETIYYLVIKFEGKKVRISIMDNKDEKFYEDKEIFEINKKQLDIKIKIGNEDKFDTNNAFRGCIGPLLILQTLKIENNTNKDLIINNILDLKNLYHFLPFFLSKESSYDYSNLFVFSSNQEENNFKNNITNLQKNIKSFDCSLYITPEIINTYYSFFLKNENELAFPSIPNTSIIPNSYTINKLDVSTIKRGNIFSEFLKNNGFDYLILVYEYFYQYFHILLQNKNELNFLLNNEKIDNAIIESIKSTLVILDYYSYYKYIIDYLKKFKTLFRNLYDMLIYSNKISNKIFFGISDYFLSLFFIIKSELSKLQEDIRQMPSSQELINDKEILSNFHNGLLDMIYSPDLFEKYKGLEYLNTFIKNEKKFLVYCENNKSSSKIISSEFESFIKIINILEKTCTNDYKNKEPVIDEFFRLLTMLLNSAESKDQQIYFKKFFLHIIKNNQNNLLITQKFLNFINEKSKSNFLFDIETFELLFNYYSKIYNLKEKKYDEQINYTIKAFLKYIHIISIIISIFYLQEKKTFIF